jgi:hypothetical protein
MMFRFPLLFVFLPLCFLFFASPSSAEVNANGAISVSVANDAAQKFMMAFLPQVEKGLQGLQLPDVKQKKDEIEVDVTQMVLTKVSVESASLSFTPAGAALSLNGIAVALNGHYKVCEVLIGMDGVFLLRFFVCLFDTNNDVCGVY